MANRVSLRLRLALLAALVAWFFSPRSIRDAVPLWLPFAIALGLEAHFLVVNLRNPGPFFPRDDPRPGPHDRDRYGDGHQAEWAILEEEGGEWVDLAEPPEQLPFPAAPPARRRRVWRSLAEAAAVLAVVAGFVLLLDRGGGWEALSDTERTEAEARFSAEASTIVGRPVSVTCDTEGDFTGAVTHADGAAQPASGRAWIAPHLCLELRRLAVDGDVGSFDRTARAIAVLSHEAWHLRGVTDEGVTECYGLQSGVQLGQRLGLDEDTARRMMRSQLVVNQLHRGTTWEYVVPAGCLNRGELDLNPALDRFP